LRRERRRCWRPASGGEIVPNIVESDGSRRGASNNWIQTYAKLGGKLTALYNGSSTAFYQLDHLASTRLLTTYNAGSYSIAENIDYLPFGEQISGGSVTVRKFTGKERDP